MATKKSKAAAQTVKISTEAEEPQVYLSVFDKSDGHRLTSYTLIGQIHGSTVEDLEAKAAENFPDAYHVPQTEKEWGATIAGDLRWNGETYTDPPEPTEEELAQQAAQEEAYSVQSTLNDIEKKAMRAQLTGASIASYSVSYQSALAGASDRAALLMLDYYPAWDGDGHSYSVGDRVTYNDTLYKVLQAHTSQATWTPTDAPSLFARVLVTGDEDTPPEWTQPDSTNPYMTGDRVTYNGKIYESTIDNNVWNPEDYPDGWKEITGEE